MGGEVGLIERKGRNLKLRENERAADEGLFVLFDWTRAHDRRSVVRTDLFGRLRVVVVEWLEGVCRCVVGVVAVVAAAADV